MTTPKEQFSAKAAPTTAAIRKFMQSVMGGDLAAVTKVVTASPDAVGWRDTSSNTALHYAASGGHRDLAALLLDRGADVNARSTRPNMWNSVTPIIVAAQLEKNIDTLQLLITRGADVNATTGLGETALMRAAQHSTDIVNQGQGEKIIRALIAAGADEKFKDNSGRTAADIADTAGSNASAAIRDAAALKVQQAQEEKRRGVEAIDQEMSDGLTQPAAILPPIQLRKEPPSLG